MKIIDLHTHSTESDGLLTPSELIQYAKQKGLSAIALTDHDTVAGIEEAWEIAQKLGIELIPGVEMGADFYTEMHILGYFSYENYKRIKPILDVALQARQNRNPRLIKRLQQLGYEITLDEVSSEAKGEIVARPHFARVLLKKKYFATMGEVFENLLGEGKDGYVHKDKTTPAECMKAIKEAGGVSIIAHPKLLNISLEKLKKLMVEEYIPAGLGGIESIHSIQSTEETIAFENLCNELEVLSTGGSDYHGNNEEIDLAVGKGSLKINYDILEKIKKKI